MYQPNDPYYYEVDNIPLEYLLENQKRLQAQIDEYPSLETIARKQWVEENFVSIIDYNERVLGGISNVDFATVFPKEGDVLTFSEDGKWTPYNIKDAGLEYLNITSATANAPNDSVVVSDGERWVQTLDTGGRTTLHDMLDFFHDPNSPTSDNVGLCYDRTLEQFFTVPYFPNDDQRNIFNNNSNLPTSSDPWLTLGYFENEFDFVSLQTLIDVGNTLTGPWAEDPGGNPEWHERLTSNPAENCITLPGKYNDNGTLKDIRVMQGFKVQYGTAEGTKKHYYPPYAAPQSGAWSASNRKVFFTHVTTWANDSQDDQEIQLGNTNPYSWEYIHWRNEWMHSGGNGSVSLCYFAAEVVTP